MEAIYDDIGKEYDASRQADPRILSTLTALLGIDKRKKYLDIACGTGNYTAAIAASGGSWFAFDHSEKMLAQARLKSSRVDWRQYDVIALDYRSNFFDAAICTLAIHHFPDMNLAFQEIARVLKPNSKFVIFTATPEQMKCYWLNHYFPEMMASACAEMPEFDAIEVALCQAGFSIESTEPFFIRPDLQDFFLYSGKQKPQMYLSSAVRNGISSFHKYCSNCELNPGLERLRKDIESGAINEIMKSYQTEEGDYLFISSRKHQP